MKDNTINAFSNPYNNLLQLEHGKNPWNADRSINAILS